MKFFVTGVGGQLGHDVMNDLAKRGYEGVGADMAEDDDMVELVRKVNAGGTQNIADVCKKCL